AIVFAWLWLTGFLTVGPALIGFTLIALAVMLGAGMVQPVPDLLPPSERPARPGDPLIEAVLVAPPHPTVGLDRNGEVIAFNAHALTIARALRRGEPVSLALRVPEVLDALRRAASGGATQRAEFYERVPVVRWYEAIVTPIALTAPPRAPSPP